MSVEDPDDVVPLTPGAERRVGSDHEWHVSLDVETRNRGNVPLVGHTSEGHQILVENSKRVVHLPQEEVVGEEVPVLWKLLDGQESAHCRRTPRFAGSAQSRKPQPQET